MAAWTCNSLVAFRAVEHRPNLCNAAGEESHAWINPNDALAIAGALRATGAPGHACNVARADKDRAKKQLACARSAPKF